MNLEAWSYVSTIVMGVAALLAVLLAYRQVRHLRRHQLETLARDHYQHFLELSVQYPEYSMSELIDPVLDIEGKTFGGDTKRFAQYEMYFATCENALESIYNDVGHKRNWQEVVVVGLREHITYMRSSRYDYVMRPTCSHSFQAFLDRCLIRKQ